MNRLTKLKSLSPIEWQILIASSVLLPLVALSLKLVGFKRTQVFIGDPISIYSKAFSSKPKMPVLARKIARMVPVAANYGLHRSSCLEKSLVLWWLLKRKGIEAQLRIGVQKEGSVFGAHSWLELDGKVLIDSEDTVQRYCTMI
jgi:hypothetical protein